MKTIRTLLVAALLVVAPTALPADDGIALQLKSGEKVTFLFSDKPSLQTGTRLTLSSHTGTVSYDYAEVRSIRRVSGIVPSAISALEGARPQLVFRITGNAIVVTGMAPNARLALYTVSGMLVGSATSDGRGSATLPLRQKGVFVVKATGGISYTFVRK